MLNQFQNIQFSIWKQNPLSSTKVPCTDIVDLIGDFFAVSNECTNGAFAGCTIVSASSVYLEKP